MAIKAIIEKLEDAPEALREHYRAGTKDEGAEGKFVLGVEAVAGWNLEDVSGLKTALSRERTNAQTASTQLAKFVDHEGKPMDPGKVLQALEELGELKKLDPKSQADQLANSKFESLKTQLLDTHKTELSAREERINKLTSTVSSLLIDSVATGAIAEAKGAVELLLPHVQRHTRVKETDGKFSVEVVDKDGNVRVNSKAEPMTIAELITEMRGSDTFGRAFDAEGHTGGGKQPDNPGPGAGGKAKGDWGGSREERRAAIAAKFKLPAA